MFSHFQHPFLFLDRLCHSAFLCLFIPESPKYSYFLCACHHFPNSTHHLQVYLQSVKHRLAHSLLVMIIFSSKSSNLSIPGGGVFRWIFQQVTLLCQLVATSGCLSEQFIEIIHPTNSFKNTDSFKNETYE